MNTLVTKLQYKNFEPGEFVDAQKRNYNETIKLIEDFPWNSQRDNIVIDLTNPSITIEGKNGDYLKLAVFYNDKYVLLYLNKDQRLFSRSLNNLRDGYAYLKFFFEQPVFETTTFKKETTWFQNNLQHFVTHDFKYELTAKSLRRYWLSTRGFNILVPIIFLIVMVGVFRNAIVLLWPGIILIWGTVLPLRLFFIYYNNVKNKMLIMSKANNTFYFGSFHSMVKYEKKDILKCTILKSKGSRSIYKGYAVIKIEFNNGTMLSIPNLLLNDQALENKLFQCRKVYKDETPYL